MAALVLGVGTLGVVALHLASAQHGRVALHETFASLLADDLLERMRANPDFAYAAGLGTPPTFVDCLAAVCTSAQLAAFDLGVWKCALGRWQDEAACDAARAAGALPAKGRLPLLPNGDGAVGSATVTIVWRQGDAGERRLVVGL